jgi:hypothetical protein
MSPVMQDQAREQDLEQDLVLAGFADLVCRDEEWLRAEFDAIVAAEWGTPPPVPPPAPPGPDDRPGAGPAWPIGDWPEPGPRPPADLAAISLAGRFRQRSPPR